MYIPKKPGVYMILDRNSRKYYIGSSSRDISSRIEHHLWHLRGGTHTSQSLQESYNMKHDLKCYALLEFEKGEKTKEEILEIERRMIYAFNATDPSFGFNTYKGSPTMETADKSLVRTRSI